LYLASQKLKTMMKIVKFTFLMVIVSTITFSCKSDDDDITPVELNDRGEQQIEDDAAIVTFLSTHFYNYEDFDFTNPEGAANDTFVFEFGVIEGVNAGKTPLIDQVETRTTTYVDFEYKYYILKLREGGGKTYTSFDAVDLTYRGQTLDLETFDFRITRESIPLAGATVSTVRGFQLGLPEFKTAEDILEGSNGFLEARNGGIGAIFFPSGLGYFNASQTGIPAYSSLIFSFNVYDTEYLDVDADGLLSSMENIDNDDDVIDDDSDGDGIPNFRDFDDDGDGTITLNEIEQKTYIVNLGEMEPVLASNEFEKTREVDDAGDITIRTVVLTDTDGDGIPDYLDVN
jgi:hypothetical protein